MTIKPITRLLVANRGEIACRIMATAKSRGISCVAVYADPDADALFVAEADMAVALGGTTATDTYLRSDKILAAAQATGADAIHPGYGFLSENADFATKVQQAGLRWIGPPPAAISAMAEKVPAKRLVAAAGVPLVPGAELHAHSEEMSAEEQRQLWLDLGAQVGYPLMVKASSGGGGKGMRIVTEPAELAEALETAQREAKSAFGDDTVFLERYLPAARHVEVQIFGDSHGNYVHLFERDCSIQRRHQKVVEEAPAPSLPAELRAGLHTAAIAAAQAVAYEGAGTVEFMVDGDEFYFLEMNTRLQVEHPVTEEITGLDLVSWQLDVAEGRKLPQAPVQTHGHAIEVRLYAEDPRNEDMPSTGRIALFDAEDTEVRIDAGVVTGSVVSPYFDPMLAKVIAHGTDRQQATAKLIRALQSLRIHGVTTNRDLLVAILSEPDFLNTTPTTAFLSEHPQVRQPSISLAQLMIHAVAAAAWRWQRDYNDAVIPAMWRNVLRPGAVSQRFEGEDARMVTGGGLSVHRRRVRTPQGFAYQWGITESDDVIGQHFEPMQWLDLEVAVQANEVLVRNLDTGIEDRVTVRSEELDIDSERLWVDGALDHSSWVVPANFVDTATGAGAAGPVAPVPGTVTAILVQVGDEVAAGDTVAVLEAMKMEHRITVTEAGTVTAVRVAAGSSVEAHQVLVEIEAVVEA